MVVCLRCGKESQEPFPPVTKSGDMEIFAYSWCADCNSLIYLVKRESSAYEISGQAKFHIIPPALRSEK